MSGANEKFDNKAVYLDTAPLIYYLEDNPAYSKFLELLFKKNEAGDFIFYTSVITLTEVLTLPFRQGNHRLAEQYEYFLSGTQTLKLIRVNEAISKLAAKLRAEYGVRMPDAIHSATAMEIKADWFLTNDIALNKIKGLNVITPVHG
ncbi:MAG TPA: PIN domain-containing protein [Cyclobacteriaceae bacterium]|jgi:predicted nucleic acid-binding protein|nr:PIN domain-containing protein [Cytophagales bacterium]HNT49031.1 PIN domain-containing protein [Cyclobacteriaceae bacterium]HRE68562.1 PIN domain-containing protein [Cyclobacteriaceae bacterium]HRF35207.1 PIN domain-containing protein [Cyclobacteriaceae bacterium]